MQKLETVAGVRERERERERELYFREVNTSFIWQWEKNNDINFERGFIAFIKESIKDRLCYVVST